MTISYDSDTGRVILPTGVFKGYSGHGQGLNNPLLEAAVGMGPIPSGEWEIVRWHDNYIDHHGHNKGPIVAELRPVGHNAHGRSGFLIHGDNSDMNHTASDGCIIAGPVIRTAWRKTGITRFSVKQEFPDALMA